MPDVRKLALRKITLALAMIVSSGIVLWLAGIGSRSEVEPHGITPKPEPVNVLLNAADPVDMSRGMRKQRSGNTSALFVPEGILKVVTLRPFAEYSFELDSNLEMNVWVRAKWNDGCGNSITLRVDDRDFVVGNDGTYRSWHWVPGPTLTLGSGSHALRLIAREDGLGVDEILLTNERQKIPSGKLGKSIPIADGGEVKEKPMDDVPPRRFAAAVAGPYRSGYESMLTRLGIPHERIPVAELHNSDFLSRYDLLCVTLSCHGRYPCRLGEDPLERYVAEGGILIAEFVDGGGRLRLSAEDDELWVPKGGKGTMDHAVLHKDSSELFNVQQKTKLKLARDIACEIIRFEPKHPDTKIYGRVSGLKRYFKYTPGRRRPKVWRRKNKGGGAIFRRPFGKGVCYRLAVPLSFHSMWRGTLTDKLLRETILHAVSDRTYPIYAKLPLDWRAEPGDILFGDDFMRQSEIGPMWEFMQGEAHCTGPSEKLPHGQKQKAFALEAKAPWRAHVSSSSQWKDFAGSVAINLSGGAGGLWVKLNDKTEAALVLDDRKSTVALQKTEGARTIEIMQTEVPEYGGWHRLSLFAARGELQGYLDGTCRVRHTTKAVPENGFGLFLKEGEALFDDVSVRPVSELLAETDRAYGEEGSCFSISSLPADSIEVRNIYAMQWDMPPSPDGSMAVEPRLPNYVPAVIQVDGREFGVPGTRDGTKVLLPGGIRPRQKIKFLCSGWMDYRFDRRVTDWYSPDGDWDRVPRWTCDDDWVWLGTDTETASTLWHKRDFSPPYAISAYMAIGDRDEHKPERLRARDLNLVFAGDGFDIKSGYRFRVMTAGQRGCELWRGEQLLKRVKEVGLPQAWSLHHVWFEVKAVVEKNSIKLYFEGHKVTEVDTEEPVSPGHLGIWTQANAASVARVTLSVSQHTETNPEQDTVKSDK
ncbi:MAG: hypothetical protein KGZ25_03460 [Planctomycetes bacterium]|nr:hypothetical protein [Planctomycetota bacterium]